MPKVVFTFFEVNIEDGDVPSFIKQMKQVLIAFAGEAYHFRYSLEGSLNAGRSETSSNGSKGHSACGGRRLE